MDSVLAQIPGLQSRQRRADRRGGRRRPQRCGTGHSGGRGGTAGLVGADRLRALGEAVQRLPADDGTQAALGRTDDPRAGQAPESRAERSEVRRRLPAVVRRGSQARLRRDHPLLPQRPAFPGAPAAGRRGGGHHALELSGFHVDPQDRARPRRRLHRRAQAGGSHPAVRGGGVQDSP